MRRISEPYRCENGSALEGLDCVQPLAFTLTLLALSQVREEGDKRTV